MKAWQISLKTVDKMSFLYELGSYCIVEKNAIFGEYPIEDSMQDLYEGGYLKYPLDISSLNVNFEIKVGFREYVGVNVSSMDVIRALIFKIMSTVSLKIKVIVLIV